MPVENVEGFENCTCHHPELVNLYNCKIGKGTKIAALVEIGKGVVVGRDCKIQAGAYIPEGVVIGAHVFVGPNACFTNTKYPMTGERYRKTVVQDGAVIGANAVILPGVTIGVGAVIGAGSIVTKDIPEKAVVRGVQATIIANKDRE